MDKKILENREVDKMNEEYCQHCGCPKDICCEEITRQEIAKRLVSIGLQINIDAEFEKHSQQTIKEIEKKIIALPTWNSRLEQKNKNCKLVKDIKDLFRELIK